MYSYFKSEDLKMKHTFAKKLVFLAPIFAILISGILTPWYFQLACYNWWYTAILPGMVSLECTLVVVKDKRMKNRAVLSLSIDLKKVWISKVIVCIVMITYASLIVLLGSIVIGNIFKVGPLGRIPILNEILGVLILIITFLWQIPLCLFLGSKIGMFPTILINIVAYMILGIVTATKSIWWLVPYAVPARLMCPILKVLPNGLPAMEGNMTFKPELLYNSVILPGVIITVILFIILTMITAKWYEGQEAK